MAHDRIEFSDDALDALFIDGGQVHDVAAEALLPSEQVRGLARRLTGQYVQVLAAFTSEVFGRRSAKQTTDQALSALDSLLRLARSVREDDLEARLLGLRDHLAGGVPYKSVARTRFLNRLRELLLNLADGLEEEDRTHLRELLDSRSRPSPLLDELASIHGIGPRRLNRLYCAGLFTVESVSEADPTEVAQVTGLPRRLAATVIDETRAFAKRERERCVHELEDRIHQFSSALPQLDPTSDEGRELIAVAQRALAEFAAAIETIQRET